MNLLKCKPTTACLLLVTSILSFGLMSQAALAGWNQPAASPLGTISGSEIEAPSIAQFNNTPYVAWSQKVGKTFHVLVSRFQDGAWKQIGDINRSSHQNATRPSIAVVGSALYATWQENSGTRSHIWASRYDGSTWQAAGADINTTPTLNAARPRVAGVGNTPYVAWQQSDGNDGTKVFVSAFNGATWQQVGSNLAIVPTDSSYWASVADINGVPYATWEESDASSHSHVYVAQFNGDAWTQVGNEIKSFAGVDAYQSRIVNINGTPFVAWEECDAASPDPGDPCMNSGGHWHTWAAQLVGGNWVIAGGELRSATGPKDNLGPSLTGIGGSAYMSWEQYGGGNWYVWVARFDGTNWQLLSTQLNQPSIRGIRPNITGVNGVPFVVWAEGPANSVSVSRLEPDYSKLTMGMTLKGPAFAATVNTFGITYPVGFQWGRDTARTLSTAKINVNGSAVPVSIHFGGKGLRPKIRYTFQPAAISGVNPPLAQGPVTVFKLKRGKFVVLSSKVELDSSGHAKLRIQCRGNYGHCTGRMVLRSKKKKKGSVAGVVLARKTLDIRAGLKKTVTVLLPASVRKLVKKKHRASVVAVITTRSRKAKGRKLVHKTVLTLVPSVTEVAPPAR